MSAQEVRLPTEDGRSFGAYRAMPMRLPAPGIVLLQEIFGVNRVMRAQADRFAAAGYVVIAPDLFWRQEPAVQLDATVPSEREKAMRLFKGLNEEVAVRDAAIALDYLRSSPDCTGRVGAVGYCLGGKLAYLMASRTSIDASVSYYGVGIASALNEAASISKPVMLHIAGKDHLCAPEAQKAILDALIPFSRLFTTHIYSDAGHAFARPGSAEYCEAAARTADNRTFAFLAHLAHAV